MENEAKKERTLEEAFLRLDEIINRLENRRKEDSCLKRRGRNA